MGHVRIVDERAIACWNGSGALVVSRAAVDPDPARSSSQWARPLPRWQQWLRRRSMKYMVLIVDTEDGWSTLPDAEQAALYGRVEAWWGEHAATGEIVEGHQLQPADTATTVHRTKSGVVTVTDGPFVEGKEMVGGYAIIDVPDLDAAIRLVSGWPAPDKLEIRPVVTSRD
jgi:hypothetical protein